MSGHTLLTVRDLGVWRQGLFIEGRREPILLAVQSMSDYEQDGDAEVTTGLSGKQIREHAERAASCWNALAGIENPEQWVREAIEALEHCLREHGGFTIKGESERKIRAVLSRAGQ